MARGRFINHKVGRSRRLNKLPAEAHLLFLIMITGLDREGRMMGDPELVKADCLPLRPYPAEKIEEWLKTMEKSTKNGVPLIYRYEVDGEKYIWMPGFDFEQSPRGRLSWKQKELPSLIPAPPAKIEQKYRQLMGEIPSKANTELDEPDAPEEQPPEDIVIEQEEPALNDIIKCYEENVNQVTPMVLEELKDIAKEYPEGWFQDAVKEAVKNNARKLSYVKAVLARWKVDGKKSGSKSKKATVPLYKDVTGQKEW